MSAKRQRTKKPAISDDRCPGCNAQAIVFHCIEHDLRTATLPAGPNDDEYAVLGIDLGVVKLFVERDGDQAITVEAFGEPVMVMTEEKVDGGDEGLWWDVLTATRMMLDEEFGPVTAHEGSHVH